MKKPTLNQLASVACLGLFFLLSTDLIAGCPNDTIPPKATCPLLIDRVELDSTGVGILPANIGDGLSTDNCATIVKENSASDTFSCADLGLQHVMLIATDLSGNSDTATCNFVVRDKLPPVAACPDTILPLYLNDAGYAFLPANIGTGNSIDNCTPVTETSPAATFTCSDTGTHFVILTASDTNGNSSTVKCYFEVLDSTPPVAICPLIFTTPDAVRAYLSKSGEFIIPKVLLTNSPLDSLLQSTDNCEVFEEIADTFHYDCRDVGITSLILTAYDPSGNMDTISCFFTLLDTFAPQVYCHDLTVYLDDQGKASIDSSDVDNNSFDACGIQRIQLSKSEFDCSDIGMDTITVTFTDSNSNVSTCEPIITIEDTIQPIAKCKGDTFYLDANGEVNLAVDDIDDGSFDNCLDTIAIEPIQFICDDAGPQIVTLTIEDLAGNIATCTSNLTIIDSTAPVALCKTNPSLSLNPSKFIKVSPNVIDNGSYDNCKFKLDAQPHLFDCDDVGQSHTITLTITDEFGKKDSCTSDLYLFEIEKPVALCKPSMTYALDSLGNAIITPDSIDAGSFDNCGIVSRTVDFPVIHCGSNLVTLTVTDASGNSASCATPIYTLDTLAPTVTCNDLKVDLGTSGVAKIDLLDALGVAFDGCGIKKIELSQKTFSCLNEGSNTETITVKDNNNNVTICFFNVEVVDNANICVPPCDTTTGLTVIPDYKSAYLSWDLDKNAVAYIIEGGKVGKSPIRIAVANNFLNASGLYPGSDYHWRVRTICNSGDTSEFSPIDTFSTLSCDTTQNLLSSNITISGADLSWDPVPGAIGYRLVGGRGNSIDAEINLWGESSTSYSATGLASGTSFNWAVFTVCSLTPYIQSDLSSISSFSTLVFKSSVDLAQRTMDMKVVPNPNNGNFILELVNTEADSEINIFNLAGKTIFTAKTKSNSDIEVDISDYSKGIYFVKLISGKDVVVKRFIVE